jgi:hypothetical protein
MPESHPYICIRANRLVSAVPSPSPGTPEPDESPFRDDPSPSPSHPRGVPAKARDRLGLSESSMSAFAPYSDDPERGPEDVQPSASQMLQHQRQLMDGLSLALPCPFISADEKNLSFRLHGYFLHSSTCA